MIEFVPVPSAGRLYVRERSVRLGDVNPQGVQRLDALARFVQDIATADAAEALSTSAFAYVLRRLSMRIDRAAVLSERLSLTTFCGGTARGWAERRTSIRGERGAAIETAAIWVPIDSSGRPVRLPPEFLDAYGKAAQGRRADARLVHGAPPTEEPITRRPWPLRYVDLDTLGHVNNAAHWCAVEEVLRGRPVEQAEIEFVSALMFSEPCEVVFREPSPGDARLDLWLCGEGHVRSSVRVWLAE
jgi:acyl-ACP thioesterase